MKEENKKYTWDIEEINSLFDFIYKKVNQKIDEEIDNNCNDIELRRLVSERITTNKIKALFNMPDNEIKELMNE